MNPEQPQLLYPPLWSERQAQSQAAAASLSPQEYAEFRRRLGRLPTREEVAVVGAMWSEHCSYKSSRGLLSRLPGRAAHVVSGPGGNAGCIELGGGLVAALKMESHNHPSFIEPVQGAATGVGGIVRDILAMGARPIATLNSLRFGPLSAEGMRQKLRGVVQGISSYGNALGVPTVGGELDVHGCYEGNILVNVMAVGIMRSAQMRHAAASRVGDLVLYLGAATGIDGIHGATMASASFGSDTAPSAHQVQVGDPFFGKLLIEATLEMCQTPWVHALQDMGAAGLTSALVEMASAGGRGIRLEVGQVPRRLEGLGAYECLLSETQERMALAIDPQGLEELEAVARKWGLECAVVGEVVQQEWFEVMGDHGRPVCQLPLDLLGGPVHLPRPIKAPSVSSKAFPPVSWPPDLAGLLCQVLGHPRVGSKRAVTQQFDAGVGLRRLPGPFAASVCRLVGWDAEVRVALSVDAKPLTAHLHPRRAATLAVAEGARNIACTGATPLALTDCLNLGAPTDPEVMWQLEETIEGIRQASEALEIPVVSGNVSLYNSSGGRHIHPTATIGTIGLLPANLPSPIALGFLQPLDEVWLIGATWADELGGSTVAEVMGEDILAQAPWHDLASERRCQRALIEGASAGLWHSAHDVSDGGVMVTLIEGMLLGKEASLGVRVRHRAHSVSWWFSEAAPKIVVSLAPGMRQAFLRHCEACGVSALLLGEVTGEASFVVEALGIELGVKACWGAYRSWSSWMG